MNEYTPIAHRVTKGKYGDGHTINHAEVPGYEATAALNLIEKWGMVAGVEDGEDSAGRAKLRLATPEEVVTRAMATTTRAFAAFREAGWLVECPLPLVEAERKAE